MQVDGATWSDNKIVLNLSRSAAPSIIKNITFAYVPRANATDKSRKPFVELPLYSNSSRASYICTLKASAGASAEAVILSGSALIVADL